MDEVMSESIILRTRQLHSGQFGGRFDDIPHLNRSLTQVHADSTRLLSARVASTSTQTPLQAIHPAALRLFSRLGFDADRLSRSITAVEFVPTFVENPLRATGTGGHLATVPPRAIDERRLETNFALREHACKVVQDDLGDANKRILTKLKELVDSKRTKADSRTPFLDKRQRKNEGGAVALAVDVRYVDAIKRIALHGEGPSAPFLMHETAVGIRDAPHFVETLAVVASVARHAEGGPEDDLKVWGARVVLEDQFGEGLRGLPTKPRLAAVAAVMPAVNDFVWNMQKMGRFQSSYRRGKEVPLWPRVYYCLRIGHVGAALQFLRVERERCADAAKVLRCVERFERGREAARERFEFVRNERGDKGEGATGGGDRNMLDNEMPMTPGYLEDEEDYKALEALYIDIALKSDDPYMRACFVLFMRLELSTFDAASDVHVVTSGSNDIPSSPSLYKERYSLALSDKDMSLLFGSVEDYLWLRLWLCRTPVESSFMSSLPNCCFVSLSDLQQSMMGWGPTHFDPNNNNPFLYPFVLVCCGLYNQAVSYLTSHVNFQFMHSGIHLGLVLYHLCWVRDDEAFHSQLSNYVDLFSNVFPMEAAIYILTIRDRTRTCDLLQELVVNSGEYKFLLGTEGEDESDSGALINLLCDASTRLPSGLEKDDIDSIRLRMESARASGYDSAGEPTTPGPGFHAPGRLTEQSLEISMRALAEVVDKQSSPRRPIVIAEAQRSVQGVHDGTISNAPDAVVNTLEALLGTAVVFQWYWCGRYQRAWEALRELAVLPLTVSDIHSCVRALSTIENKFHPCFQSCSQELLKVALEIAEFALENKCVLRSPSGEEKGEGESMPEAVEIKSLCIVSGLMEINDRAASERLIRIEMLLES